MGKMGIFGGTFDPVHWGHLLIAESALCHKKLDQVIWVTNERPHYKQTVPFEHRWEMVRMAIADHPAFTIFPKLSVSTPSYAILTLIELQAAYPNTEWYWILGLDTFQTLPAWYRRQEIATACNWIIAPRLGSSDQNKQDNHLQFTCERVVQQLAAQSISIKWEILNTPIVGVSSSLIRQYCCNSRSIRYLVPEPVRNYIAKHNLYSSSQ